MKQGVGDTILKKCSFSGLERIAEELMGRRKWKLYQESMSRSYLQPLNNNIKRTNPSEDDLDLEYHHKDKHLRTNPTADSDLERKEFRVKPEINGEDEGKEGKEEYQKENEKEVERLRDWAPQTKCYFCVDGKLDSEHTNHGVLVSILCLLFNPKPVSIFLTYFFFFNYVGIDCVALMFISTAYTYINHHVTIIGK